MTLSKRPATVPSKSKQSKTRTKPEPVSKDLARKIAGGRRPQIAYCFPAGPLGG